MNTTSKTKKTFNRDNISHCEKSTITEAWALLKGEPRELDNISNGEMKSIEYRIQKGVKGFKIDPTVVVVQNTTGPIAPYWNFQGTWNSRKNLVRTGHEYLSVHSLSNPPEERYGRFDTSIKPHLSSLLNLIDAALIDDGAKNRMISTIGFGYVNSFRFNNTKKLSPTDYFNLNVGINNLGSEAGALVQYKTSFNFESPEKGLSLVIDILAGQVIGVNDTFEIVTQIHAEKKCLEPLNYADKALVLDEVRKVQKIAKLNFYKFATDKTLEEMGAVEND